MANQYAAFISYAHRYQGWVKTLRDNLERGLAHAGRAEKVFLDEADLGTGRSWVGQLQAGIAQARHLVLVVTPEALASPRVTDEWEAFIGRYPDWNCRFGCQPILPGASRFCRWRGLEGRRV